MRSNRRDTFTSNWDNYKQETVDRPTMRNIIFRDLSVKLPKENEKSQMSLKGEDVTCIKETVDRRRHTRQKDPGPKVVDEFVYKPK